MENLIEYSLSAVVQLLLSEYFCYTLGVVLATGILGLVYRLFGVRS